MYRIIYRHQRDRSATLSLSLVNFTLFTSPPLNKEDPSRMQSPVVGLPSLTGLKVTLIAGLTLLTTGALFAQSADQTDVNALKMQMNQMQKQYEQRIEAMETKIKSLESKAGSSSSILNTRVLTDADGKDMDRKTTVPALDESFLKSLTRNFTFTAYMRAGVGFNGSGGSQSFNFEPPDNYGGRSRLGNENDTYMELTLQQNHILGDGPDVMDVSARFTLQYANNGVSKVNAFNTLDTHSFAGIVEAYVLAKNVFKGVPEVGFWAGDRFYDRWNVDSLDYFWLNTSGLGFGIQDIPLGPGKLWLAWLGGADDNLGLASLGSNTINFENAVGNLYKQTLDVRWKEIDIGLGKLTLVGIANYAKGAVYSPRGSFYKDLFGVSHPGVITTPDMYGIGGGAIWQYDFVNKSYLRVAALFGYGATDFNTDPSALESAVNGTFADQITRSQLGLKSNVKVDTNGVYSATVHPVRNSSEMKAIAEYIWNVAPNFSLGVFGVWENNKRGYQTLGTNAEGSIKAASGTRNMWSLGMRPVYWVTDTIAIQGQANLTYQDNNRGYSGTDSFGRSGAMGVFTIAPTIKPKGGYLSRPELRVFATYAVWSDSLKGTTTPVGEGGNFAGAVAPYNGNTNSGWIFGGQVEVSW